MKNYIVRKASTRDAISKAIMQGECKSVVDVEAIATSLGDEVFWPGVLPDTKSVETAAFLREIGVPASLSGYTYLKEAINQAVMDQSLVHRLTTGLYPAVAEKFQTTPSRVERTMRHSIEVAWMRGDLDTLQKRFGYTVSADKGRPTVGEFVALAAEYVSGRA